MAAKKDAYSEPLQYPNIKIFFWPENRIQTSNIQIGKNLLSPAQA